MIDWWLIIPFQGIGLCHNNALTHYGVNRNLFWVGWQTIEGPKAPSEARSRETRERRGGSLPSLGVRGYAPWKFKKFYTQILTLGAFLALFVWADSIRLNFCRGEKILSPQYFLLEESPHRPSQNRRHWTHFYRARRRQNFCCWRSHCYFHISVLAVVNNINNNNRFV